MIRAETPADLKAMLAQPLAKGPVEVVVVGDTSVDAAIKAVAATFGALAPRDAGGPDPDQTIAFPAPTSAPVVLAHTGRADQAVGLIAWPTEDFYSDTLRARRLAILGEVLELRLTDQLRKAESVTYSPEAQSAPSNVFPHYGYMLAEVEVPPAKLDGFFSDVQAITADLRANDVSADELERAKKPAVEDLERRRADQRILAERACRRADRSTQT